MPDDPRPEIIPGVKVDDWFEKWVAYHCEVNPREDWESTRRSPFFWGNFKVQLRQTGVHDMDVAIEASNRVSAEQLRSKADHVRKVLDAAREIYAERRAAFDPMAGVAKDKDAAREEAKGCLDCGGDSGVASRYIHREFDGRFKTAAGHPLPIGSVVSFYCACAMGRWMRVAEVAEEEPRWGKGKEDKKAAKPHSSARRLPDLAAYPAMIRSMQSWDQERPDNQHCYHPDQWDAVHNVPITPHAWTRSTAHAHDHFRQLRARMAAGLRMPRPDAPPPALSLTPSQEQFVQSLDPASRVAFESMSSGRKAEALSLFRDQFNPSDVRRVLASLPATRPEPITPPPMTPEPESPDWDPSPY